MEPINILPCGSSGVAQPSSKNLKIDIFCLKFWMEHFPLLSENVNILERTYLKIERTDVLTN